MAHAAGQPREDSGMASPLPTGEDGGRDAAGAQAAAPAVACPPRSRPAHPRSATARDRRPVLRGPPPSFPPRDPPGRARNAAPRAARPRRPSSKAAVTWTSAPCSTRGPRRPGQLVGLERSEAVECDLAPGANVERQPFLRERLPEIPHTALHLGCARRIVLTDAWRRGHDANAVGYGRPRHRDTLLERPRAVVESREDVRMEVDHKRIIARSRVGQESARRTARQLLGSG